MITLESSIVDNRIETQERRINYMEKLINI